MEKEVTVFTEDYRTAEHIFKELGFEIVSEELIEDGLYTTYKLVPTE